MLISSVGEITSLQRGERLAKSHETSLCHRFTSLLTSPQKGAVNETLKAKLTALTAFNTILLSGWVK